MTPRLIARLFGSYSRNFASDRKGAAMLMMAVLVLPMLLLLGLSIDGGRAYMARQLLQDAADSAALAGAVVYSSSIQDEAARTVADRQFRNAIFPAWMASPTNVSSSKSEIIGNSITVTASADVDTTFMNLVGMKTMSIGAAATALNPIVTLELQAGNWGSGAQDWNAVYIYNLPRNPDGSWNYTYLPKVDTLQEIGSNCNPTRFGTDITNHDNPTRCWTWGDRPPATVTVQMSATQAFSWALRNVTGGNDGTYEGDPYATPGGSDYTWPWGYVSQYASPSSKPPSHGNSNWHFSGFAGVFLSPETATDQLNAAAGVTTIFSGGSTSYRGVDYPISARTYHYGQNCSLQVSVVDPANPPSLPPSAGGCFQPGPADSAYLYTNKSCAELGDATYKFWWNDMGDVGINYATGVAQYIGDNYDYTDLTYMVHCGGAQGTKVRLIK